MKKKRVKSAIYTNLYMWRSNLVSKEEVKQKYLAAADAEFRNEKLTYWNRPSVNNDLEFFLSNLRNPDIYLKRKEVVHSFLTQELTADELQLVNNHNEDYAKTLCMYCNFTKQMSKDQALENFKKTGEPDSKFVKSFCQRQTYHLHGESILARIKHFKKITFFTIVFLLLYVFIVIFICLFKYFFFS